MIAFIVFFVLFSLGVGISFLLVSGLVALICWGLTATGFIVLEFSWPLAIAVYAIIVLLGSIFKK